MDTGGLLMVGVLLLGFSLAGAFLITMTLGAVRRLRELPRGEASRDVGERLDRIEAAVESVRLDVERLVELQRLAARHEPGRLPIGQPPERHITPH